MKKFSTPDQLAKRWHCSANTVRNLIAAGKLDAYRVGKKLFRISDAAIEEYEQCMTFK